MQTTLYKIKFKDGREFRVFCANSSQKQRMHNAMHHLAQDCTLTEVINGIHTVKQWEEITATL
tara:strand:+ start:215 stop:403 length:189 start_codon:yes stop_codon:yes gene_type:complete